MEHNCAGEKMKYHNYNYSFENVFSVPLIINKLFQFLDKGDILLLSLCNKKIYQFYCMQVNELKINESTKILNLEILIDKYCNANILNLNKCKNIKDFTLISKFERLEIIDISNTNISDISFLEKNKKIKELYLNYCEKIIEFKHISKLKRLETLKVSDTNISDISFLEENQNLKKLEMYRCKNIKYFSSISKIERLENLDAR